MSQWILFNAFVILFLIVDLGVFRKKDKALSYKESLIWSLFWVLMACLFGGYLYLDQGNDTATSYFTGYVIEKSLSLDNVLVFALIFKSFRIPKKYQYRVLFWGILSALILRAGMIYGGILLVESFEIILYVFGAFLILTGLKFFTQKDSQEPVTDGKLWKFLKKRIPLTSKLHKEKFTLIEDGKRLATPLLGALILVEMSDVIFAVDSIPAILAITTDPYIVYTSNVFAILGLRSLYFLLSNALDSFIYLKPALGLLLCFVGLKMLHIISPSNAQSLMIILSSILTAIVLSIFKPQKREG